MGRKRIIFVTDNLPITPVWHQGTSSSKPIMLLIRKLYNKTETLKLSVNFIICSNCFVILADLLKLPLSFV